MLSKILPVGEYVTWNHTEGTPYDVDMTSPLEARAVRLHALTYTGAPIMRLEFYGCALGMY